MTIDLNTPGSGGGLPVLKRRRLGESFTGMLVKAPEQRDVLKEGAPVLKDNGKPRQELVVTLMAITSTMVAGLGGNDAVPEPGDLVRVILRGGGYGQWIDAEGACAGRKVGDVITITSTHGQAYDANGRPSGGQLTTQADIDALPRSVTLGIYGDLAIRRAEASEEPWVTKAEAAYHSLATERRIDLEPAPAADLVGF